MPKEILKREPFLERNVMLVRIALIIIALLILAAIAFAFSDQLVHLQGPDTSYAIADRNSDQGYVYSASKLAQADVPASPPSQTYAPEGLPPIDIEAREDGMYACTEGECALLFEYGTDDALPVAYTVSGDTLYFVSPLIGELQAFRLVPERPLRLEPLFFAANEVMPGADAIAFEGPDAFILAESVASVEGASLRVCRAVLAGEDEPLRAGGCAIAPLAKLLAAPYIAPLR